MDKSQLPEEPWYHWMPHFGGKVAFNEPEPEVVLVDVVEDTFSTRQYKTQAEIDLMQRELGIDEEWFHIRGITTTTKRKELIKSLSDALHTLIDDSFQSLIKLREEREFKFLYLVRYTSNEDLWRYRRDFSVLPIQAYDALIRHLQWRTKGYLDVGPIRLKIVNMQPDLYEAWLLEKGYSDSEAARSMWAAYRFNEETENL